MLRWASYLCLALSALVCGCSSNDSASTQKAPYFPLNPDPVTMNAGPTASLTDSVAASTYSYAPKLIANASGDKIALWLEEYGSGWEVRCAFLAQNGTQWQPISSPLTFNSDYLWSYEIYNRLDDAVIALGDQFVLVWPNENGKLFSRTLNPGDSDWSNKILLNENDTNYVYPTTFTLFSYNNALELVWAYRSEIHSKSYTVNGWQPNFSVVADLSSLYPNQRYYFREIKNHKTLNKGEMLVLEMLDVNARQYMTGALELLSASNSWTPLALTQPGKGIDSVKIVQDADGGFIVWSQIFETSGALVLSDQVLVRRFQELDNGPNWSEQTLVSSVDNRSSSDLLAASNNDSSVIVWRENLLINHGINASFYQASTAKWSDPVVLWQSNFPQHLQLIGKGNSYYLAFDDDPYYVLGSFSMTDPTLNALPLNLTTVYPNSGVLQDSAFGLLACWQDQDQDTQFKQLFSLTGIGSGNEVTSPVSMTPMLVENLPLNTIKTWNKNTRVFSDDLGLWVGWSGNTIENNKTISKAFVSHYNGSWQTETALNPSENQAGAVIPRVVTSESGQSLVVWYQYDDGYFDLYASTNNTGNWGPATSMQTTSFYPLEYIDPIHQQDIDIAASGQMFLYAINDGNDIKVRRYNGNQWDNSWTNLSNNTGFNEISSPSILAVNNGFEVYWYDGDSSNNITNFYRASLNPNTQQWDIINLFSLDHWVNLFSLVKQIDSRLLSNNKRLLVWVDRENTVSHVYAREINIDSSLGTPILLGSSNDGIIKDTRISNTLHQSELITWVNQGNVFGSTYSEISSRASQAGIIASLASRYQLATANARSVLTYYTNIGPMDSNSGIYAKVYDANNERWSEPTRLSSDLFDLYDTMSLTAINDTFTLVFSKGSQSGLEIRQFYENEWHSVEIPGITDSSQLIMGTPFITAVNNKLTISYSERDLNKHPARTGIQYLTFGP